MKHVLTLAVITVLTLGLIVGCSPAETTETSSGPTNASTATETPVVTAPVTPEIRTLTVLCADSRPNFEAHKLSERDNYPVYVQFEEELAKRGLALEYETVAADQLALVIQTRMASGGDLPNILGIFGSLDDTTVIRYGKEGLILDIRSAVEQYDEDGSIFALWDRYFPSAKGCLTAENGAIYWFPYLYAENVVDQSEGNPYKGTIYTLSIRKDWLDAAGIEYKQVMSPEELKDAFVAFREQDVNESGEADETMSVNFTYYDNGIAQAFGIPGKLVSVLSNSETVQCPWYMPHIKDYIAYMKDLVDSEIYNTGVLDWAVCDQLMAENKIGLLFNYLCQTWMEPQTGIENAEYAPIVLVADIQQGTVVLNRQGLEGSMGKWAVTSGTDVETAVDLFDYIYSQDYYELSQWGIEGISYTMNADGTRTKNDTAECYSDASYTSGSLNYLIGQNALPDLGLNDYTLDELYNQTTFESKNAMEEFVQSMDAIDQMSLQPLALATDAELETITQYEQVLTTYSQELITDLILGNKSLDDLDQYIQEMKTLGLDEYIAVFQARYDRFREGSE